MADEASPPRHHKAGFRNVYAGFRPSTGAAFAHDQVSRLGFILRSVFPFKTVTSCSLVSFTVAVTVRKFHPCSLGAFIAAAYAADHVD